MRMRASAPDRQVSDRLREILIHGPHAIGLTYHDLPPHDELRALWRDHGAALKQAHPRRLWFEERDLFVRILRGEE